MVLDQSLIPLPVSQAELGLERQWKVGPSRYNLAHPAFVSFAASFDGIGLRTFAPAHVRGRWQGGDLMISWVRTTRIGGDSLQSVEVPLGEDLESYRVSVRSAGTLLREVSVTSPNFAYTAAMIAEDAASGTLVIAVSQLSSTFGYGPERAIEIDV